MRRKQLAKRVAIAVLSAATVMTSVPATAVFAATATAVVSPVVNDDDTTSTNAKIKTALSKATATRSDGGALRSDMDPSVLTISGTDEIDGKATNGTATSVSSVAAKLDSTGKDIEKPQVQIGVSLTTGTDATAKNVGSGAITVDAEALTASEKVAIADLVATANKDDLTYYDNDDAGSIKTKVQSILNKESNAKTALALNDTDAAAKALGDVHLTFTVSNVSVTKPEGNKDGSVTYTINWTATPYVKSTTGESVVAGTAVTKSTTLTGTIKADGRKSDSDEFEDQVTKAVADATFTNDDFTTSGGTTTLTDLTSLKAALRGVDALKDSKDWIANLKTDDITVSRFTAGKHGQDGSARLTFNTARNTDVDAQNTESSVTVRVTVKHSKKDIQAEVYNAIWSAVQDLNQDSTSLQATAQSAAAKKEAVQAGIKKTIDSKLADTLGTSTTIASEIAKYDVVIDKYQESTDTTPGSVKFHVNVDSGIKDAADPSKTETWNIGKSASQDHGVKDDENAAKADAFEIKNLAKLGKVEATSLTLPATMTYLYGSKGLEIKPTFTPADANKYTIRWTNSNTTDFGLYESTKDDASAVAGRTVNKTVVLKTKKGNNVNSADVTKGETTVTAELIGEDGVVLAKASTVVSIGKGFDDVQNPSFYAYKAINTLAGAKKCVPTDTTAEPAVEAHEEVSPVIEGIGDNKFDPNSDVTRGQFVTFLYRLAKNDYTYLTDAQKIGQKDPATVKPSDKFSDVDAKAYYAQAVAWATENGVVNGKNDTTFAPNDKITRAEAVTILYRYYANGAKYSHKWSFTDVKDGSFYADAVAYAANEEVTNGKSDTVFAPNDNLTRAEAAVFIARAEVAAGNYGKSIQYGNY